MGIKDIYICSPLQRIVNSVTVVPGDIIAVLKEIHPQFQPTIETVFLV